MPLGLRRSCRCLPLMVRQYLSHVCLCKKAEQDHSPPAALPTGKGFDNCQFHPVATSICRVRPSETLQIMTRGPLTVECHRSSLRFNSHRPADTDRQCLRYPGLTTTFGAFSFFAQKLGFKIEPVAPSLQRCFDAHQIQESRNGFR